MPRLRILAALAVLLGTAACTSGSPAPTGSATRSAGASDAPVRLVASTDVYGDIAKAIGGDAVAVTSIIDEPDQDPHEYEANAQTQLALSKAQIVIENGAGYDDFVDTMLKSAGNKPTVLNVADISGFDQKPAAGDFNEHVWYDFPTVAKLVTQLSDDLATASPAQAGTIKTNAATFTDQLTAMEKTEADIKAEHAGDGVAITEPVPLYLLGAAGLTNETPPEFSEAIEEDSDVSPAILKQTLALFDEKKVKLLAYNEQTTGPQTEAVLAAAKRNNIAVVPVTETLPSGKTYLTWMRSNLDAVSAALDA